MPTQKLGKLTPEEQISVAGVTCNSRLNTWRKERPMTDACRLDYALIDANRIVPVDAKVMFTETLPPPLRCSFSDHFAYFAEFKVESRGLIAKLRNIYLLKGKPFIRSFLLK